MVRYSVTFSNGRRTRKIYAYGLGIIPAIENAIRKDLRLLGWEIVKAEKCIPKSNK